MLFHLYEGGEKRPFSADTLTAIGELLAAQGGVARKPLMRPFGPDGHITHTLFDFEHRGDRFTIDVRMLARGGVPKFHAIDTSRVNLGWAAGRKIAVELLVRLGLAATFSQGREGPAIVGCAEVVAHLPEHLIPPLTATNDEAYLAALRSARPS